MIADDSINEDWQTGRMRSVAGGRENRNENLVVTSVRIDRAQMKFVALAAARLGCSKQQIFAYALRDYEETLKGAGVIK